MWLVNVVCLIFNLKRLQLRLTEKGLPTMQAKTTIILNSYHGSTNIFFARKET